MSEPPLALPAPDCDVEALLTFAGTYNAYERWADSPNTLLKMLGPIRRKWESTGQIPSWAGLDALRALMFYEYRADYFSGGSEEGQRHIRQVLEAIRLKVAQQDH